MLQNLRTYQFLNRERIMAPALPEVMLGFRSFMVPIHRALVEGNPIDLIWNLKIRTWI